MDDHENNPDPPRNPSDLHLLQRAVESLAARLDKLEERMQQSAPDSGSDQLLFGTVPSERASAEPKSKPSSKQAGKPKLTPQTVDRAPDFETQLKSGQGRGARKPIPKGGGVSAPGPAQESNSESLPVVLMGIAGGFAILAGLLFFAWYSIQQGWISPAIRLSIGAALGAVGMLAAWRMGAGRHKTVAASLGGAGLGVWFGVILVARHVHALLEADAALALLALGAAGGYCIASQRNLRFVAILAAVGAFVTPLCTGFEERALNALMLYQAVVIVLLYRLESRRNWPELGHIAVASTWLLLNQWAVANPLPTANWTLLGWTFAILLQGHLHNWYVVRKASAPLKRATTAHLAVRSWAHGLFSWAAASLACNGNTHLGQVYLALAVLNLGNAFAIWMLRNPGAATPGGAQPSHPRLNWILSGSISVAWLQLFAFAPIELSGQHVFLWWAAMSVLAWAIHTRAMGLATFSPILLPYAAALIWSFDHRGPWAAYGGFLLAAIPLAVGLWPAPKRVHSALGFLDRYLACLMLLGATLIMQVTAEHMPDYEHRNAWLLLVLLISYGLAAWRCSFVTTIARGIASLLLLLSVLALTLHIAIRHGCLQPDLGHSTHTFAVDRLPAAGIAFGIAAVAQGLMLSWRKLAVSSDQAQGSHPALLRDLAGILRPLALLLTAVLCVTEAVPHLTEDPSNALSLNQAGWSLCFAIASLSLLVRGLLQKRALWRQAGLAALFATTVKLITVDLVEVSTVWRVLSFVGLGVCLLLGAYAYRRLGNWVERTDPGTDPGTGPEAL